MHIIHFLAKNTFGDFMTIMIIRSIIIYIFITIATRVMGKRQIGELKPQELVITILISAVATIPLQESTIPLSNSIMPILIFVSLEIIQSAISMKSLKFRNLMQGKPIIVIKNGVLQQKELSRLRFTLDDLIDALRQGNAFDISQVENAVIETNGTLSIQLKGEYSPITPSVAGINAPDSELPITIVMDGEMVTEYFGSNKMTEKEIQLIINSTDLSIDEIMLLTIDDKGKAYLVRKDDKK